nr:MAG TPA: hypothetical protein [Caudoviricetes sp.]
MEKWRGSVMPNPILKIISAFLAADAIREVFPW